MYDGRHYIVHLIVPFFFVFTDYPISEERLTKHSTSSAMPLSQRQMVDIDPYQHTSSTFVTDSTNYLQPKQHRCRICGKGFLTRGGLSHHMKVHGTKRFQCPVCPSNFLHKHHMRDHVRNLHGLLVCVSCQKTFSFFQEKLFADHLVICKNVKSQWLKSAQIL